MPDGGRLRFAVGSSDGEAPRAWIAVEDTGSGMPEEVRSRVFEPFFTTKERGQGTGLGLSIVHGIVADHGGTIEVSSSPEAGTSFRIEFPRCAPASPRAAQRGPAPGHGGRGETVLVVEDNAPVRATLTQVLEKAGYRVLAADRGALALAVFEREAVDLVLLDIDLPGMSGTVCLERLRERRRDLPCILMSGLHTLSEEYRKQRDVSLLSKPFRMSELVAIVGEKLDAGGPPEATAPRHTRSVTGSA